MRIVLCYWFNSYRELPTLLKIILFPVQLVMVFLYLLFYYTRGISAREIYECGDTPSPQRRGRRRAVDLAPPPPYSRGDILEPPAYSGGDIPEYSEYEDISPKYSRRDRFRSYFRRR